MKTNTKIKKFIGTLVLSTFTLNLLPLSLITTTKANSTVVYPLKKISKLECRFNEFKNLGSECIEDLPILYTKDYARYATENGGYNKFTRLYTVLWGASYNYRWDVGYGGHMGTDIATAKGTPVYSIADGEVIQAGTRAAEGIYVSIKHNINGKEVVSNYMHLAAMNVTKGDRVKAGDLIGEVGSTGNSTGNHLHLQIDVVTKFSPIYYDRSTCPYPYLEITESGKCFDELTRLTVDPLLFLETNGAILNSINTVEKIETARNTAPVVTNNIVKTNSTSIISNSSSGSIFDRGVNIGANPGDIREVQSIYKSLGYYNGDIDGDYTKVYESIIKYQLDKNIIYSREDDGAGNFGPKTRAQTKKDYEKYLASGGKPATTLITSTNSSNKNTEIKQDITSDLTLKEDNRVISNVKTEKISRENLMTREELEAKEVNEFLSEYNIDLKLENNEIGIGQTEDLKVIVTNRRGKVFRGSMPGEMTFQIENEAVSVFPEKLFYFTDGKRDIKITGLKNGNIKLKVFIGKVNIKTFDLVIGKGGVVKSVKNNTSTKNVEIKKTETPKVEDTKNPTSAQIISRTTYSGDTKTAIAILKNGTTNFVNKKFDGTYKLKASSGNQICLKKGNYSDLENIYKSRCNTGFKNEINFNYEDTVGGVLVFEYKALNKDLKFEVTTSDGKKLAERNVAVIENNSLAKNYKYNEELAKAREKGIISNDENFSENKSITEKEAVLIVKNTLQKMDSSNQTTKNKIYKNLSEVTSLEKVSSDKQTLTRAEVLDLAKKYLILEENSIITINFQDLDDEQNSLANAFFSHNETWKETNGNIFFKPTEKITKGEMVYLVVKTLKNANQTNVTLK